jgi:hypothetical protein
MCRSIGDDSLALRKLTAEYVVQADNIESEQVGGPI